VRLNLGCGWDILPGWLNTDASPNLGPDVHVWDLDRVPWPWMDATADEIRGIDIFEHVHTHVAFMTECHRILRPGGVLRLQTTYWRHPDSYTDPTHTCHPTEWTFDFWVPGSPLYDAQNTQKGGVAFEKIQVKPNMTTGQLDVVLRRPGA
jgi:cyclopropane fatty-acyl-phospholipid synthase-like methyltransferase